MRNAQLRKLRAGRRWTAAAAWILAAGTLLGGAGMAKAYDWAGIFIVDTSGWDTDSKSHVQWWIGHGSYTACSDMTKISNTHLYYHTQGSTWSGAAYLGFFADDHNWGSWGGDNSSNYKNAPYYTKYYNGSYGLDAGSHYFFARESSDNDAAISPTYYAAYGSLNLSGTLGVKVKNYGASTYSEPSTSPAKVTMGGYKLKSWTAAEASSATLSAGGTTVSTTYTTVLGNTVTYEVSSIASGYVFDGWYDASGTQLSTAASYTSDYCTSTAPDVYAHFTKYLAPVITEGTKTVTETTASLPITVDMGGSASTTLTLKYSTTDGSYTTAATVSPTSLAADGTAATGSISDRTPGTTYFYQWTIGNAAGTTTKEGSFTTLAEVPGKPTLGTPTGTTIPVTIDTGNNPAAVEYAIKVVTGSTEKFVQANGTLGSSAVWQTAATWGTKTVTGLANATTYTVSVAARNSEGTATAYGTSASATTASGVVKPTITEGAKTIGTTTATLPITVNMGGGATSQAITLKYGTTSGSYGSSATVSPTTLGANVTAGEVTGTMSLSAGTAYYYQWTVANSAGSTTAEGSFATEPTAGTVTLTGATASSLKVTGKRSNGYGMLIVMKKGGAPSWTPTDGSTYTGRTGDRAITSGTEVATGEYIVYNGTDGTAASGTSVTISGLDSGSRYYAKVYTYARVSSTAGTYNYNTTSPGSANAYTLASEPTWATPSLTAMAASDSQIDLSWGAATGASGYLIIRTSGATATTSTPSDGAKYSAKTGETLIWVTSGTSTGDTGLSPASTYSYRIYAYKMVSGQNTTYNYLTGTSLAKTATDSAMTFATEPTGKPTLTLASRTVNSLTFTITKGANAGYTLLAAYTKKDSDTGWSAPVDGTKYTPNETYASGGALGSAKVFYSADGTTATVKGLTAGAAYYIRAYSYNGDGTTIPANYYTGQYATWSGRTMPNTPTLTATVDGKTMVRLTATKGSSGTTTGMILVYGGSGTAPATGTVPDVGGTFAGGTVVGKWTSSPGTLEHVVAPGTTHNYRLYSYASTTYSAAASKSVSTGSFASDEIVDTFSYTNGASLDGLGGEHGWSGAWSVVSGGVAPTVVSTNANEPKFANFANYPDHTGNRIEWDLDGDGYSSSATRTFAAKTSGTLYAAAMVSYQYNGAEKWCGIGFRSGGETKVVAGRVWESSDNAWLGIDNNSGTRTHSSSYEMKPYNGDTTQKHLVILKYDFSAKEAMAIAYWNGSAVPTTEPEEWSVTNTSVNASSLDGIILQAGASSGKGEIGKVYFDEVRVATSWTKLLAREAVKPAAPSAFSIEPDGKEMIRGSVAAAESTILVVANATGSFTAPADGTSYSEGDSAAGGTVVYKGAGKSDLEFVVAPGSTTHFAAYAYNGDKYSDATLSSPASLTTGTYLANENVDTFSYTNATKAGTTWQGGAGWAAGGNWTVAAGTWTAMRPASQPGHESGMPTFGEIEGYPAGTGNLVKLSDPGSNNGASMTRDLPRVIASADKNFYVAFRMAYQYEGANKWAGLSLLDSDGVEKGFVGKGSGSYWYTLSVQGGGNQSWGGDLHGFDGAPGNTYLVIMRYSFENNSLSAMTVQQGGQVPDYEPTQWEASIGVSIPGIKKLMFQAGGSGDGVTIGDVWFDELRWGTSWSDILSGVCPESISQAQWQKANGTALSQTYLGNSETFQIRSAPTGFGQEAWLTIDWGGTVATTQMEWQDNVSGVTWWSNKVQLVKTGKVGGTASTADYQATAKVTAMNAPCEVTLAAEPLEVLDLGAPTSVVAAKDATKPNSVINVSWTPWQGTLTGVDTHTKDVLVVRFTGANQAAALAKAALAANQPVQGRTYMAGDSIGEGTVVWRGGDGGEITSTPAKGLMPNTSYAFAVYTENYSYYSVAAFASETTDEGGHDITVDGDATDWYGEAPDTLDTAWVSLGEFIWKDKTGEERHSAGSGDTTVGNPSSDIDEFRVYADKDWVYFLVKMTEITDTALPYVAVGLDDRRAGDSAKMNWLGDESATVIGSNYWGNSEAEHYPRWQLNVHQVKDKGAQVEAYTLDSTEWYAPQGKVGGEEWAAAIGQGAGKAVEFRVPRSDIGLDGMASGATTVQRFTVATFKNTGAWNNQGAGTAEIYSGTSKAVDTLGIAPQRPKGKPDNDYLLGSWDEDIADGKLDFWVDVAFDANGIVENRRPDPPSALVFPAQEARLKSSPTFEWTPGSDTDGQVTGYLLEVSTDPAFDDLNGTVELRVNVAAPSGGESAPATCTYAWSGAHQQTMYYWRVRSRDNGGRLSVAAGGMFWVDEDGDGPVAVLKYVGADVEGYLAGNYAQQEKLYPESLHTVTDAEIERVLEHPELHFGFVIEWTDPNGVYATNQVRKDASGTRSDGYASEYREGDWAWNITSGDGRVSPNWDLVEFHKNLTDRNTAPTEKLDPNRGQWTTNFWDEMGCWGYQWGYDDAFMVGTEGTKQDQTRGKNGDQVVTNLVRQAFELGSFDTNVDYYLTVSAEDCTTWKESGSGWWDDGSWDSFKPAGAEGWPGADYSSGWCKDGPNRARNVTTNQLLEILVTDNDMTPPGASGSLWNGKSLVVSTTSASGAPGADPADQLTLEAGEGLPVWTAWDSALVGEPLAFHFNVFDSSMTGIQVGVGETASVTVDGRTTTMTNSSFVAGLERLEEGEARTVTWTNWNRYDASRSSLEASGAGMGAGTGPNTVLTWYWPAVSGVANIEDFWPPKAKGPDGTALAVATNAIGLSLWDPDNDRDGDQAGAVTTLGYLKIADDDATNPNPPSAAKVNGVDVPSSVGAMDRATAAWTNNLSGWELTFAPASDPEPANGDLRASGVDQANGYRMAKKVEGAACEGAAWLDLEGVVELTTTAEGSRRRAGLSAEQQKAVAQGLTTQTVFAVDMDADRAYDALASTGVDVPLAFDITPPMEIGYSGERLTADPYTTDDPTTQFDLRWPTRQYAKGGLVGIGPDDPDDDRHPTKAAADTDVLSPWYSYKIYFSPYDASQVPATDAARYIYDTFVDGGEYKAWPAVMANSTVADPSAPASPYDSLGTVSNAATDGGHQSVRLYDLDFDQDYVVVIVGVDKAGNEGPAGMYSWATNDTIKFAITQGLVRTSAKIAEALPRIPGDTGLQPIDGQAKHGAVLYWMAAGQKDGKGKVKKEYDFIYRDAPGFSEEGTEQWNLVGTVKTNWNYQTDGMDRVDDDSLRFFRASYAGRWQGAYPLASEEVYSMNNVVLSEGFNYVSLQGVPYTNTFAGVFGTDTDMWPGSISALDSAKATRIEFYQSGPHAAVESWYFFGTDGKWYTSKGDNVTDTLQLDGFFAKPFGIVLPHAVTNKAGEVTEGWWLDHSEYAGAKASASKSVHAMLWHPILQVPTNGPSDGVFAQTVDGTEDVYNTLSLNLPVAVHPRQLGLVECGMHASDNPWDADKLYSIDPATKEVRGASMMYCDAKGTWRWVKNQLEVTGPEIKPNDMLLLISSGKSAASWTWEYTPAQFYKLPDRHMGRKAPEP
jgi:hypothetical protein